MSHNNQGYPSGSSSGGASYPAGGGSSSYPQGTTEDRPHVITERTNNTPVEALRNLIVEISGDGVSSYFCGWQNCQYPVGFAKQSQLISHIRSVHLQERPFICTTCHSEFERRQDASRHVAMMNRRQYKCSGCSRIFSRKDHRDIHEEKCLDEAEEA